MKKIWLKISLVATGAIFSLLLLPKFASASTLFLSPGSGNFSVGQTFSVSVVTNTQGAAVNTAEANISYSTSTLQLVSVKQGSTFYLISPGSPAKGSGTAYFGGGLPTPGYTGSGGVLGSMTFRAIALGDATVSVDSGHVLLNDGLGTDSLNGQSGAKFTIAAAASAPVGGIAVTSATDPNPDAWYASPDVTVSWNRPSDVYGYSFELDQNPNTVPDSTLDTTVTTTKTYTALKDGVWYFHIHGRAQSASAGFGATTDFKIQIDTTAPATFELTLQSQAGAANPQVSFTAQDTGSGLDHFEASADGKVVDKNATSPYTFEGLSNGSHQVKITAFDKAGNSTDSQLSVDVKGVASIGFFQKSLSLPLYLILLINLLVLLLLALIIWLIITRRRRSDDPVSDLQRDIDETLETLKGDIDRKLLTLTSKSSEDLMGKELKVAKAVSADISKTKRKIDGKIDKATKRKKVS